MPCPCCCCPGRQAAVDEDLAAVPAEWKRLSPHPLRWMQARALAAMATGADVVVNAATGSGKGLLLVLPAAAAWHAAEPGVVAPIDLVIVPYKALGMHLEKTFNALFKQLAEEGRLRPGARALFVRRGRLADSADEPEAAEEPEATKADATQSAFQVRHARRPRAHRLPGLFFPPADPPPLRRRPPPPAPPPAAAVGAGACRRRRAEIFFRRCLPAHWPDLSRARTACRSPSASPVGCAICACVPTASRQRPLRVRAAASTRAASRCRAKF